MTRWANISHLVSSSCILIMYVITNLLHNELPASWLVKQWINTFWFWFNIVLYLLRSFCNYLDVIRKHLIITKNILNGIKAPVLVL